MPLEVFAVDVPGAQLRFEDPGSSQQTRERLVVMVSPVIVVDPGVLPNSAPNTTSIWSSSPLAWRSAGSALIAWSRTAARRGALTKLSLW